MKSAKAIAAKAWQILLEHRNPFFRLGFISSIFSLAATSWYFFYQYNVLRNTEFFSKRAESLLLTLLSDTWTFLSQDSRIMVGFFVTIPILLLGWYFIPMLIQGAVADLTKKIENGKEVRRGVISALFRFFPLFEIQTIKKFMSWTTFFMIFSITAQYIDPGIAFALLPILIFFGIIGMFVLFFFSFTTQGIMVEGLGFGESISRSSVLVLNNIRKTVSVLLIILLIELRVLLNIIVVLALPFLLVGMSTMFAYLALEGVGILIGGIVAFIIFCLTAYLTGILFVYSEIIWTLAFLEFSSDED